MAILAVSIAAYCINLLLFRKDIIVQQLICYTVYIVTVTYLHSLDIALPVYFVFSLIPFLGGLRRVNRSAFWGMLIFFMYLVVGMLFQNTSRAITMFISRCWQFIFFFVVYNSDKEVKSDTNFNFILKACFVLETLLAIYLYLTKRGLDVIRLTAGAQPITGNTAIITLPIICYVFYVASESPKEQTRTIILTFMMAFWVALSGTRGYELVFALVLLWLIKDYIFRSPESKNSVNRFLVFFVMLLLVIGFLFVLPEYLERVISVLRLNKKSVGIRTYENAAAIEFMINAPILVKLFGVGIGGTLGNYSAFQDAVGKQFALGMWNRSHYLYDSGSLFHNLYMNVLCNMGIVGIITIVVFIVLIWKTINNSVVDKKMKTIYRIFFAGILVMNYYRWSTDCGIAIMGIFALLLKLSSGRNRACEEA